MRGIRKCPKCKTVNGTRSSSCKNRQCNAIFKEQGAEKRKRNTECVKVSFVFQFVANNNVFLMLIPLSYGSMRVFSLSRILGDFAQPIVIHDS